MGSRRHLVFGLAGALAVVVAIAGLAAVFLTGDGEVRTIAFPSATPVRSAVAGAEQTATPVAPTATETVVPATVTPLPPTPTVEATAPPNRTSCDEMRGTDYRSGQEREFFIANCLPTPAPVAPNVAPSAPELDAPAAELTTLTATIGGRWLIYDGVGINAIEFDADGDVLRYEPAERISRISGRGSIQGNTMAFQYTAFDTAFNETISVSFSGIRLRDDQLADFDLSETFVGVPVFFGEAQHSMSPGLPLSFLVIKVRD